MLRLRVPSGEEMKSVGRADSSIRPPSSSMKVVAATERRRAAWMEKCFRDLSTGRWGVEGGVRIGLDWRTAKSELEFTSPSLDPHPS